MIKRIREILNRIHEESLDSFIRNQHIMNKLINDSIKENNSSNPETLINDFRYSMDWKEVKEVIKEIPLEDFSIEDISSPDELFDHYGEGDVMQTKVFKDFMRNYMSHKVFDIYDSIFSKINNGAIELYRALDIEGADWVAHLEKQGKHLGVFWADDLSKAEAYWGTGGNSYIVHTVIDEKNIDWYNTFMARLDLTLGDEEQEIRLFKGTPIRILDLYDGDTKEKINIDTIKDKTFYA